MSLLEHCRYDTFYLTHIFWLYRLLELFSCHLTTLHTFWVSFRQKTSKARQKNVLVSYIGPVVVSFFNSKKKDFSNIEILRQWAVQDKKVHDINLFKEKNYFCTIQKKLPKLDRSNFGNYPVVQIKKLPRVLQNHPGKKQEKTNRAW